MAGGSVKEEVQKPVNYYEYCTSKDFLTHPL